MKSAVFQPIEFHNNHQWLIMPILYTSDHTIITLLPRQPSVFAHLLICNPGSLPYLLSMLCHLLAHPFLNELTLTLSDTNPSRGLCAERRTEQHSEASYYVNTTPVHSPWYDTAWPFLLVLWQLFSGTANHTIPYHTIPNHTILYYTIPFYWSCLGIAGVVHESLSGDIAVTRPIHPKVTSRDWTP